MKTRKMNIIRGGGVVIVWRAAILAVVFCVGAASSPSFAADRTIDADYRLTANETVDGTLTVAAGVTVDLNGYSLTVNGLAGEGTITSGPYDLTSPDPNRERVTWTSATGTIDGGEGNVLFNDNYERAKMDNTKRILAVPEQLPFAVTYDFGTPKKVDAYRIWCGPWDGLTHWKRGPKSWTFEGTDDTNGVWTVLDSRMDQPPWLVNQEMRTYAIENAASYRYYRVTFGDNNYDYFELVQLEFFDTTSVAGPSSELHIVVPTDTEVVNSTVTIAGNVKLVKEGAGTFVGGVSDLLYTGGNLVSGGTLKSGGHKAFGAGGSEIRVEDGCTYDFDGVVGSYMYRFKLNGGTIANYGESIGHNNAQIGVVDLLADSTVAAKAGFGFRTQYGAPVYVDLNGHTLSVTNNISNTSTWIVGTKFANGTVRIVSGGIVFRDTASSAETASFDLKGAIAMYTSASVRNLTIRAGSEASVNATADGVLNIYGTFKTETDIFPFVTMCDGSTLDLTDSTDVFNTVSANPNTLGYKLSFANDSTVTIDISGRTFALGDQIIAWDEKPSNVTFKFDDATAAKGITLTATDVGLYYGTVPAEARWTGAANDGNLANPQNWSCKDGDGNAITGVPTAATTIILDNSVSLPASFVPVCGVCLLTNCTLAEDCDLRGLGSALTLAKDATINLDGHKLYVPGSAQFDACTVKGKNVDHSDDLTDTTASCVSSPTIFEQDTKASNLFNNNYERSTKNNTRRILVGGANLPLEVTYTFPSATVVDAYRIWTGPIGGYTPRLPRSFRFEGSNNGSNWTTLDLRRTEVSWSSSNTSRTYTFDNDTAYTQYRFTVYDCNGKDKTGNIYLEMVQLEFFRLKATRSEFHVDAAEGDNADLANVKLEGNLRFFKDGAGTATLSKTWQEYVGGTEVVAGGLVIGSDNSVASNFLGLKGCEVVVHGDNSGISYSDTNAHIGFRAREGYTGYRYVLAGGAMSDIGLGAVTDMRLVANSYMITSLKTPQGGTNYIGGVSYPSYVDLNGHTLSVDVTSSRKFMLYNTVLDNGTLAIVDGGWFGALGDNVSTNSSVHINCATDISGTFAMRDCIYEKQLPTSYNMGDGIIDIYGTLYAKGSAFHGMRLHNGATIDISELPDTTEFNVVAPFNDTTSGDKLMRFAENATIGMKLGERKSTSKTPVIHWTTETKPADSVKFISADVGSRRHFIVKDDGLYLAPSGLVIIMR